MFFVSFMVFSRIDYSSSSNCFTFFDFFFSMGSYRIWLQVSLSEGFGWIRYFRIFDSSYE